MIASSNLKFRIYLCGSQLNGRNINLLAVHKSATHIRGRQNRPRIEKIEKRAEPVADESTSLAVSRWTPDTERVHLF